MQTTTIIAPGISYEPIGTLSAEELTTLFAEQLGAYNIPVQPLSPPTLTRGASLYRIHYTIEFPDSLGPQTVSGLLMIPEQQAEDGPADGTTPLVIYNHGTLFNREQSPSNTVFQQDGSWKVGSAETLFNLALLADKGYALIAADYVGYGINNLTEGYGVKQPTSRAIVGMLEASRSALTGLGVVPGPLYLTGWSQGGLNTQWAVQSLEALKVPVVAAAAASPFNELADTARWWLTRRMETPRQPLEPGPWIPLCAALLLNSYEFWHGQSGLLDALIKDEVIPDGINSKGEKITNPQSVTYREVLRRFADFGDEVVKFGGPDVLSNDLWQVQVIRDGQPVSTTIPGFAGEDMLVPGVLDQPEGVVAAFLQQLEADSPRYWTYETPFKAWYGLKDEALPPELVAPGMATEGGPQMTLVPVEGGSHRLTFLNSLLSSKEQPAGSKENLIDWFDSFGKRDVPPPTLELADNSLQVVSSDFGLLPVMLQATGQQGARALHVQISRIRNDGSSEVIGSLGGTTADAGQLQSLGSERLLLQVGERLGFQLLSRRGDSIEASTTEIRPHQDGNGFQVILRNTDPSAPASLSVGVMADPLGYTPSPEARIAAPQGDAHDGLLQLHAGQTLRLTLTSDCDFENRLGFVQLNLDSVTGLPLSTVGAQSIDINSDAFRQQIDSLLVPGFQITQSGRKITTDLIWNVANDGVYAAVLITPEGHIFCGAPGSTDRQMLRLGQNRLSFEDQIGPVSDYDWNDQVLDIVDVS